MDPKGIYKEELLDDQKIPGNADSGKGKTYARHIIYNDGTEVWEYHRYSGQGRENDPIVSTETMVNADQEKRWKEQSKTAQTQADQAERKITRTYTGTDPTTGKPAKVTEYETGAPKYEEITPTATAATATGADPAELRRQRERNQAAGAGYYTDAEISEGIVAKQKEDETKKDKENKDTEAKRGKWTEVRKETKKNEQTGVTETVVIERNELGEERTKNASEQVTKNNQIIDLPNGQKASLIPDPSQPSGFRVEPIAGTGPNGKSALDVSGLKLEAGKITQEAQTVLQQIKSRMENDPNYTWKDGERDWNQFEALKGTRLAEIKQTLDTQGSIYRDESANYRSQLEDQQSRRTFASTTFGQAAKSAGDINPYLQPGSDAGGKMMLAQLAMGMHYAGMMGGTKEISPPTMGAGLQQAKGITLDLNSGQIHIGGGGSPEAALATAPISGGGAAAPSDFAAPPGMNFSGGQLSAGSGLPELEAAQAPYLQDVRGADPIAHAAAMETTAQLTEDPFFDDRVVSAFREKYRV